MDLNLLLKIQNMMQLTNKVFILGAGGVVSSIILALIDMNVSNIIVTNRTKRKADNLKKLFKKCKHSRMGRYPRF